MLGFWLGVRVDRIATVPRAPVALRKRDLTLHLQQRPLTIRIHRRGARRFVQVENQLVDRIARHT